MPWEKAFDVDEAVDRATEVFWAKGYVPTSISDLVAGMGINKGSLYNAFGSKLALFKRVFLKYEQDHWRQTLAHLETLDDPIAAISKLFESLVEACHADADRKGCLLVNTALELPHHTADVREMVTAAFGEIEWFFRRALSKGQRRGTISRSVNVKETAHALLSLVVGLRVLSRGVFEADSLTAVKKNALKLVSG